VNKIAIRLRRLWQEARADAAGTGCRVADTRRSHDCDGANVPKAVMGGAPRPQAKRHPFFLSPTMSLQCQTFTPRYPLTSLLKTYPHICLARSARRHDPGGHDGYVFSSFHTHAPRQHLLPGNNNDHKFRELQAATRCSVTRSSPYSNHHLPYQISTMLTVTFVSLIHGPLQCLVALWLNIRRLDSPRTERR